MPLINVIGKTRDLLHVDVYDVLCVYVFPVCYKGIMCLLMCCARGVARDMVL